MKTCVCHNISDKSIKSVLANFFHGVTIITKRRGDLDGHTQEKGNLDEARMLVEDARNIALDLVKITSNEPLKVEGVPEVAPVLPPATTTKTTLPQ